MSRPLTSHAITIAILMLLLVLPSGAHAGDGYGNALAWPCTGAGAGGRDAAGVLYVPCGGSRVAIVARNGSVTWATVSTTAKPYYSLAPTPDGTAVYTITSSWGRSATIGTLLQRLKFNATRTALVPDTTFQPTAFRYGAGTRTACGRGIATDEYGYVYVSNGGWCMHDYGNGVTRSEPNLVVKYRPDGSVVTTIGDIESPSGEFNVNMGIAVTRDGRRLYVAEHTNQRVRILDWQLDGSYAPAGKIDHVGNGAARHRLAATYDVKLDDWGYIYVAETTPADYWKLRPDGTTLTRVADLPGSGTSFDLRLHSVSIDARGYAYSNENGTYWPRAADNPAPTVRPPVGPEPIPDLLAPMLRAVLAPATSYQRVVRITVNATDPDGTIAKMRLADASGEWQPWRAYEASFDLDLGAGYGAKVVYLQLRDAAGHESVIKQAIVTVQPIPDTAAPTVSIAASPTAVPGVVELRVDASDDVAVTHVRIAGDDGEFGSWWAWDASGTLRTTLEDGRESWTRYVQVRDAAWNVSTTAAVSITRLRPAASTPPVEPVASPVVGGGGPVPAGNVDRIAPRIVRLVVPRRSCSRRIVLRVAARDAGRIVSIRVANEDGRYGRWRPYRGRMVHFLSRGRTYKRVTIQVRDASGNVSRASSRLTRVVACRRR